MMIVIFGSIGIIGAILFFTEVVIPIIGGLAAIYSLCKGYVKRLFARHPRKEQASYKGEFLN